MGSDRAAAPATATASVGVSPPPGARPCLLLGAVDSLTTGSSWVDIEAILDHRVSDTTVRALRLHGEPGGPPSITGTARSVLAIFYIIITFLSGHTEIWSPPGSPPWSHRGHRNLITWLD